MKSAPQATKRTFLWVSKLLRQTEEVPCRSQVQKLDFHNSTISTNLEFQFILCWLIFCWNWSKICVVSASLWSEHSWVTVRERRTSKYEIWNFQVHVYETCEFRASFMWNFSEIPQIPTLISTFPKSGHPPESKKSWDGGSSKLTRMVTEFRTNFWAFRTLWRGR